MPITIPIEIGDVIRTGKFKNKRVTVKEIGLDEYQLPTVNGKGIMKIRIEKLMPPKEPKQENNMNINESINTGDKVKHLRTGATFSITKVGPKVVEFEVLSLGTPPIPGLKVGMMQKTSPERLKPGNGYEIIHENNMNKPNKAKLDRMITSMLKESFHPNDTQVKIKQKDKLWWICQTETDECLNAVGFDSKEQAEHSALTKGYNFSGQENMNEMEPEVLTTKKEKTKGVDKVEDMKLDKEKEIKLEILRIAKRVVREEVENTRTRDKEIYDFYKNKIKNSRKNPNDPFIRLDAEEKTVSKFANSTSDEDYIRKLIKNLDSVKENYNKKKSLTELEVTDPSIVKKLEEMAKMSDEIDRLKNEMTKLKKLYEPLDEEITAMLEEVAKTGDRALETKTILVTIKKMGNPAVEVAAYKERFEQLYSKVNGAMKKQADEYWESVRTFKKIPTSIGVQYKKTEGKLTEDNVISRLVNKVKSFFSNIYNKIVQYGKISENGISELHKLTGV